MRHQMALVKNVINAQAAYQTLAQRDLGIPGMMLIHGDPGFGKTTTITWLVNQANGVFVRANATWTANSMLAAIMEELGSDPMHSTAKMLKHIAQRLSESRRPLFVDEANYLGSDKKMLNTLKDIHDMTDVPVLMAGAEGIERKLPHHPTLARRISQWVEFKAADLDDAATLANTVCEVALAEDLLVHLHRQAKGSMGLMTVGLARIESFARSNGIDQIDAGQWGDRQLFMSRQPGGRR